MDLQSERNARGHPATRRVTGVLRLSGQLRHGNRLRLRATKSASETAQDSAFAATRGSRSPALTSPCRSAAPPSTPTCSGRLSGAVDQEHQPHPQHGDLPTQQEHQQEDDAQPSHRSPHNAPWS